MHPFDFSLKLNLPRGLTEFWKKKKALQTHPSIFHGNSTCPGDCQNFERKKDKALQMYPSIFHGNSTCQLMHKQMAHQIALRRPGLLYPKIHERDRISHLIRPCKCPREHSKVETRECTRCSVLDWVKRESSLLWRYFPNRTPHTKPEYSVSIQGNYGCRLFPSQKEISDQVLECLFCSLSILAEPQFIVSSVSHFGRALSTPLTCNMLP